MRYALIIGLFALIACSIDPTRDEVSAFMSGRTLIIDNNFDEPVYFFIIGNLALAYTNWAPILSENNSVRAERSRSVSIDDIFMDEADVEIAVIWWRAVEKDGEMGAGVLQGITVPIPE